MRRSGEFLLKVHGPDHCGVVSSYDDNGHGIIPCRYLLIVNCDSDGLDHQGFLVEQLSIDDFFKSMPATDLSCENLCKDCVKKLRARIQNQNPAVKIRSVFLEMSPYPHAAGITYHWSGD